MSPGSPFGEPPSMTDRHGPKARPAAAEPSGPPPFASAFVGGEFECLPVRDELLEATLRVLRLEDLVMLQATTSRYIGRGGIAGDTAALPFNMQATQRPARVNGVDVSADEAILAAGSAEITAHNLRRLDWATLALPCGSLAWGLEPQPGPT